MSIRLYAITNESLGSPGSTARFFLEVTGVAGRSAKTTVLAGFLLLPADPEQIASTCDLIGVRNQNAYVLDGCTSDRQLIEAALEVQYPGHGELLSEMCEQLYWVSLH